MNLKVELMNIFFDESGTKKNKPTMMAGLLIPHNIYYSSEFNELNRKLRESQFTKLHWTVYTGHAKLRDDIFEVLTTFAKYARYAKLNVINYNENPLDIRKTLYNQEHVSSEELSQIMIYTKIPERILYGLLRNYGNEVYIKSTLFIEHSNRYEKFGLNERLLEQLNIQSMYRGEQFSVVNSHFKSKKEEIGVEITDLLLGFLRQVIKNEAVPMGLTDEELKKKNLKGKKAKNDLTLLLLKNKDFLSFISSIKYYEWESNNVLIERNFKDYLTLFLAAHHRELEKQKASKEEIFQKNRRRRKSKVRKVIRRRKKWS